MSIYGNDFFPAKLVNSKQFDIFITVTLFIIFNLLLVVNVYPQTTKISKSVLILHAQDQFLPSNIVMDTKLYATLKNSKTIDVTIYSEYLELVRFNAPATQAATVRLLHAKYDYLKPDLLLITDDLSWDFWRAEHAGLFHNVPVVLCGITEGKVDPHTVGSQVTGNFKNLDIKANIDTILQVLPDTRQITVIVGASAQDAQYEAIARRVLQDYQGNFATEFLAGKSLSAIQGRISHLPLHTAILYITIYRDSNGLSSSPRDFIPLLRETSTAPIFGVYETFLNYGIVGGNILSFSDLGQDAATTALAILSGDKPAMHPLKTIVNNNYFDWLELKKWGIPEGRLPPGSIVINRQLSLWELYGIQIISGLVFIVLETGLLAFLVIQLRAKRKAEAGLKLLNATLDRRVRDRTAQLENTNHDLEAFSYSVSHDLRAPLRYIDGFVELLEKSARETLAEKSLHYLDTIAKSAKNMGVLIDELLLFFRNSNQEIVWREVDMNQILGEAREMIQQGNHQQTIEWLLAELPNVQGDPILLSQVWSNLLGNAAKYSRNRSPARIEVSCKVENGLNIFSVRDNGVGFDMRYAAKLFGIFQRLHSSTEFEGNGIGLVTVQRIITRHGGRIWATAEPEQGAVFYFSLPQNREEDHA